MGYLYLAAALAGGVAKGLCGKGISREMQTFRDCLFINTMRMLFCFLLSFLMVLLGEDRYALAVSGQTAGICAVSAVGMSVFCVCWMYAYRTEAYIFLNIFTMLGTVITCVLDYIFYGTPISGKQGLGIGVILCAVLIVSRYNREIKGKMSRKGALILALGCIGSAVADFSQRAYMAEGGNSAAVLQFYSYAMGLGLLAAGLWASFKPQGIRVTPVLKKGRSLAVYGAMSAGLFINSRAKTLAAGLLPSAQIYPVLQGANLIASILLGHFLFRERISGKSVAGMACAFTGLMIMGM